MVRVDAAEDGTFTLLLDGRPVMTGLTRPQADRLAAAHRAKPTKAAPAAVPHPPARLFARLRRLLRLG